MASGSQPHEFTEGLVHSQWNGISDDLQELLTVEELATVLKVSRSWVYEHTRSRGVPRSERLPHVKIGKYVRFDARQVREFLLKRSRMG